MPDLPHLTAPSTTTPTRPPSAPDPADGPLGRLLLHPGATLGGWAHELAGLLWDLVRHPLVSILASTALLGVPTVAWLAGRRRQARLARGARWVQILPPPVVEPPAAEALWANLSGLLRSRWWLWPGADRTSRSSCGGHWGPGDRSVGAGRHRATVIERAVKAAWPGARTDTSAPGPPLPLDRPTLGGTLRLAEMELLPLRTEHWVDPLRALLGAAGELAAGEAACVQILARPAGTPAVRRLRGSPATARLSVASVPLRAIRALLDLLTPGLGHAGHSRRPAGPADPARAADTRAMLAKTQGPAWQVCVRYGVAAAHDPDTTERPARTGRRGGRGRRRARAHALAAAFEVHSGRNRLARRRLLRPAVALASRQLTRRAVGPLSATELATLAHLPIDLAVPGLTRAGARPVAPAAAAPTQGKILGDAEIGPRRPVALTPAAARQHLHLIGATGSGKSTLICNLALDDIRHGRGVVVIDPKGDLIGDLLDRLPEQAHERLVLLDPDEADAPPAMNVLEGRDPDLVVDHLVGILHRIWHAYWGPRIDDVLRASCLTLLRRPGATLAEVPSDAPSSEASWSGPTPTAAGAKPARRSTSSWRPPTRPRPAQRRRARRRPRRCGGWLGPAAGWQARGLRQPHRWDPDPHAGSAVVPEPATGGRGPHPAGQLAGTGPDSTPHPGCRRSRYSLDRPHPSGGRLPKWLLPLAPPPARSSARARADQALTAEIRRIHKASGGILRRPRIHAELGVDLPWFPVRFLFAWVAVGTCQACTASTVDGGAAIPSMGAIVAAARRVNVERPQQRENERR